MKTKTRGSLFTLCALAVLATVAGGTDGDPAEWAKEARGYYDGGQYARALAVWLRLLDESPRHEVVTKGDAHWSAARCHRALGEFEEAVDLLEDYARAFPKGDGVFGALTGIFYTWAEAGEERKAQKAGARVFKLYPDSKGTFWVLRTYLERGWKVPKLATDYDVLKRWAFDRVDANEDPDLRLGILDLIAAWHKRSNLVSEGSILYCQAWCHLKAGRPEKVVELGEKHLQHYPRASERDKVRMVVAEAYLDLEPPKTEKARKVLTDLLNNPGRFKEQAEKLLAAARTGGTSIQVLTGCPTPEGLGRVVLLTDLGSGNARLAALKDWREARDAEVVRFRPGNVAAAADELRRLGPEFVAVVVAPQTVSPNFQLSMLELCRSLDPDPMPDFAFGYLTARDAEDLGKLAGRILEKERIESRAARMVGVPASGAAIEALDYFLHYGHGTPRGIVKGLSAADVAELTLPRGPVIFSGACFNGVCGQSYVRSLYDRVYHQPEETPPEETLVLSWIHAGATGVIAAMDGDRGEMAGAEWEHFLAAAPSLGHAIGYQYRLIFATLKETYGSFPRYLPGRSKRTGFFDVMLRGATSRILISDPSYRPLATPLAEPLLRTAAAVNDSPETVTVEIEVLRSAAGPFVNTLPGKAGIPWKESRVYGRVALPAGFDGMLGTPQLELAGGSAKAKDVRVQVRHEIWGGIRHVNVLASSERSGLASPGSVIRLVFPVNR